MIEPMRSLFLKMQSAFAIQTKEYMAFVDGVSVDYVILVIAIRQK
jgi:hypothetical protein